jgi:hypothetical protein
MSPIGPPPFVELVETDSLTWPYPRIRKIEPFAGPVYRPDAGGKSTPIVRGTAARPVPMYEPYHRKGPAHELAVRQAPRGTAVGDGGRTDARPIDRADVEVGVTKIAALASLVNRPRAIRNSCSEQACLWPI